jgi:hypothetical protein
MRLACESGPKAQCLFKTHQRFLEAERATSPLDRSGKENLYP